MRVSRLISYPRTGHSLIKAVEEAALQLGQRADAHFFVGRHFAADDRQVIALVSLWPNAEIMRSILNGHTDAPAGFHSYEHFVEGWSLDYFEERLTT